MFVMLSRACQQESWGGGWAWCPGKAAESDWVSRGVAELFGSSCCTELFHKGRAGTHLYFSSCCLSEHHSGHKCAHGLNTLKLIPSRRCTLPGLLQTSVWFILQLIPKHKQEKKSVVEIQGKKEARPALTTFMSPPKVAMDIHGWGKHMYPCLSLTAFWNGGKRTYHPKAFSWMSCWRSLLLPPIVTSWLSRAGGTSLLQQCLQVYRKQAEARLRKWGGTEQGGWIKCPEQRKKIEIPLREPFLPLEGTLKGCFKRFIQWTEEDMLQVQAHIAFRYVHGAFRDSLIYLRCRRQSKIYWKFGTKVRDIMLVQPYKQSVPLSK